MSDLFEAGGLSEDAPRPLADRLRPKTLAEVVGQDHLIGPEGPIGRMVAQGRAHSIILWGPPGTGKTTIARLLPPDVHTKTGGAIYPDQCTEGFHIYHNVVTESLRWLYLWNPNIRGNHVENNYADTAMMRNDGPDNIVEPVTVIGDVNWPEPAKAIAASAGLEPDFTNVREFDAASDLIVESNSVDFQPIAGAWTSVVRAGSYGAFCQESTDPKAAARWVPVLSKEGFYKVSVWRPPGSAAATYVVRHAHGEASVSLQPDKSGGHWALLGRYPFRAGTDGELTIRPATNQHPQSLLADAVRFEYRMVGANARLR